MSTTLRLCRQRNRSHQSRERAHRGEVYRLEGLIADSEKELRRLQWETLGHDPNCTCEACCMKQREECYLETLRGRE
jgi:hypothetical protein